LAALSLGRQPKRERIVNRAGPVWGEMCKVNCQHWETC